MASLKKRHEEFIRELQAPLKHSVLLLEHNGRKFPDSVSLDEQLIEEVHKNVTKNRSNYLQNLTMHVIIMLYTFTD